MREQLWFLGQEGSSDASVFLEIIYEVWPAGNVAILSSPASIIEQLQALPPGIGPGILIIPPQLKDTDDDSYDALTECLALVSSRQGHTVVLEPALSPALRNVRGVSFFVDWCEGAGRAHLKLALSHVQSLLSRSTLQQQLDGQGVATLVLRHKLQRSERKIESLKSQLKAQALDYQKRSRQDPVTGLSNRSSLLFRLSEELERAQNEGSHTFCLALLNLRRFKVVNGSLGSSHGDKLLNEVGRLLGLGVRKGDMVARLGSDEFAIVAAGLNETEARTLTQRLLEETRVCLRVEGRGFPITASMGAVIAGARYARPDEILRDAGVALSRGREIEGSGTIFFDPSCHLDDRIRLELESDILRGLEREEFNLVYQPIIDVPTGEIAGFEGLLRWSHPKYGAVGPNLFIPVAEVSGLIIPLGQWILSQGIRDFATLKKEARGRDLFLSLNVSRHELCLCTYPASIEKTLKRLGMSPSELRLEVTETACVDSGPALISNLKILRAMGIQILIDDFGVGQSSLGELYQLPADGLKVDRAFVVASQKPRGQALLRAIVDIGQALGLAVIAEGVEDEAQQRLVAEAGCEYAQGFLFGRGVAMAQALSLLRAEALADTSKLAG